MLKISIYSKNDRTLSSTFILWAWVTSLYIAQHSQHDLVLLEKALSEQRLNCTAVAEIGLERAIPELLTDLLWRKQCEFLEAQLYFAKRYDLPVNLHSRKAHDQLFTFLNVSH
ncbi:deoxyribonuclease TatD-like protein [Pasteurella canis]|uniref:Deoxyribonuclease TatD-like protein n=1 Tax=Pasteurella canis TaxID=753 RepID=A0A379ERV5_9PAST|nr:deoxyribonuclease TatD-like protein [Pasteurella canis]